MKFGNLYWSNKIGPKISLSPCLYLISFVEINLVINISKISLKFLIIIDSLTLVLAQSFRIIIWSSLFKGVERISSWVKFVFGTFWINNNDSHKIMCSWVIDLNKIEGLFEIILEYSKSKRFFFIYNDNSFLIFSLELLYLFFFSFKIHLKILI